MRRKTILGLSFVILILINIPIASEVADAETYTVAVPDDFSTIQEAINQANSSDTILVREGTYYEQIHVNKSLSLIGENNNATIDGNGTLQIISAEANNSILRGFRIQNGETGVATESSFNILSNITIIDNHFENCSTGIRFGYPGSYSIISSYAMNNTLKNCGVAINVGGSVDWRNPAMASDNIIQGNTIENCSTGIWFDHANSFIDNMIINCETGIANSREAPYFLIANNTLIENGLGIGAGGNGSIIDNFLYKNGRGIVISGQGHPFYPSVGPEVENNLIYLCSEFGLSLASAGGLNNSISGNHIWNNNVGIAASSSIGLHGTIFNNTLEDNSHIFFAAFSDSSCDITLFHNNFINNSNTISFQDLENYNQYFFLTWNQDYPNGGNFWTEYDGIDLYSGSFQNTTGSDGIGDTPFNIDEKNDDNYPLMNKVEFPISLIFPVQIEPIATFFYSPTEPIINQTVTFDASASHDLDGQIASYLWDLGDGTNIQGQTVVEHFYATEGMYNVTLNVTDNDGLYSSMSKIINVQKISSSISLLSSETTMKIRETATLYGSVIPLRNNAPVTIWQRLVGGNWSVLASVSTNQSSTFSYNWMPSEVGTYELKAGWEGDNYTFPAESSILVIELLKIDSKVSISTSSVSTVLGFKVNVTGRLLDEYENALKNENVVLYYTFSGAGSWTPITSDLTDNEGYYAITWIPTATGYFTLRADWSGNATHSETNDTNTLSSIVYNDQYVFSVESNSSITALSFDTDKWKLSFNATGPDGTEGYVKLTIAKSLIGDIADIGVYLDGLQYNFTVESINDSWLLTFVYLHSAHQVEVNLGSATRENIFDVIVGNVTYHVAVLGNSTVSEFSFNEVSSQISFIVSGPDGTTGFCNITIPDSLMSGTFSLFKDEVLLMENVDYTSTYNGTHYVFQISYMHSDHTIKIVSSEVIPEFPLNLLTILIIMFILAAYVILTKKLVKKQKQAPWH